MESLFASVKFKPFYGNWNRSYRVVLGSEQDLYQHYLGKCV